MGEVPSFSVMNGRRLKSRRSRLMVNRSATWAEWDFELVAQEIAVLKSLDFDSDLNGVRSGGD